MTLRAPDLRRRQLRVASLLVLGAGGLLVLWMVYLSPSAQEPSEAEAKARAAKVGPRQSGLASQDEAVKLQEGGNGKGAPTAEQIVARRLALFSIHQRALVHKLADHYKVKVPSDVERFFDALDAGNWDEAQRLFKTLRQGEYNGASQDESLQKFWRPIVEAYGGAEQAHDWPAQLLLDYGNGILNSLPPGMVYVGGNDSGCFIPTMLNATSDGDPHITLTQNALADNSYLEYLRATEGGSLNIPTPADSQAAFDQYVQDAKHRLEHDEQFPNEPPQLLPGENVSEVDGQVHATGLPAVMAIDNILMQDMVKENPGVSFGLQESSPMPGTYAGAAPLGPIFELNAAGDGQNAITSDAANQVVNYWQSEAGALHSSLDAATSDSALSAYAHDAASQGNLLANNNYPDQAEQAYESALDISPNCLEAIQGLTKTLAQEGLYDEAGAALNNYALNNPSQSQAIASYRKLYLAGR